MRLAIRQIARSNAALWSLYSGYRAAHHRALALFPRPLNREILPVFRSGPQPTLQRPTSQICTAAQCNEAIYAEWCKILRTPQRYGRKQWEHIYILETLRQKGLIKDGMRGLGFGCGREPSVAALAQRGCQVVATDLAPDDVVGKGWIETNQHASSIQTLNEYGLCDAPTFERNVSLRYVDMNAIPHDLTDFDFTWSSCALEHLGSLRHGLDFIINSTKCLRIGGVAVHTTEFNLSSDDDTLEDKNCVVYRKNDLEKFAIECEANGISLSALNWQACSTQLDEHVDREPFSTALNLKIRLQKYVCTSIGLTLTRIK